MTDYLNHSFDNEDLDLVSIIDELPLWSAPFGLKLLDKLKLRPGIKALDIGSGLGFPLIEVAQRLGNSCKVIGIEPWPQAVDRIRLKIKTYNLKNIEVIQGVAEKLDFGDDYFDLIVSNNGINNVADITQTLAECARVAKPGAQFILTLNLEDTMKEFYQIFEHVLTVNGLQQEVLKLKDQIYLKRKPLSETEALLTQAGFEINSIKHDSFSLRFLDANTMFNHVLIKYWFLPGWKEILQDKDRHRIFQQVEHELDNPVSRDGELKLTIPFVTIDCSRV